MSNSRLVPIEIDDNFLKVFIKRNEAFSELLSVTSDFFQERCFRQYLTAISANSTFRIVFHFKKLKIIYCWDIYHFLLWSQASAFVKWAVPTSSELYREKTLIRPFNPMPRIVACNSITKSSSLSSWKEQYLKNFFGKCNCVCYNLWAKKYQISSRRYPHSWSIGFLTRSHGRCFYNNSISL